MGRTKGFNRSALLRPDPCNVERDQGTGPDRHTYARLAHRVSDSHRLALSPPTMAKSRFEELDSLQKTLNHAIDTLRYELIAANLPPLSLQATEPHPLDDCSFPVPPRLYEARRLALGMIQSIFVLSVLTC